MSYKLNVDATGAPQKLSLGGFAFAIVRASTAPVEVSFDGQYWRAANQNDAFGPLNGAKDIYFRAVNNLPATVTFDVSDSKLTAQDTAQSLASTFAIANLGIAVNAAVNGALPACDANGYLQITNAAFYLVSGKSNGHPRQQIVFSVSSGSLNVLTPDSQLAGAQFVFMTIPAGQVISLDSDTDWIVSGAGGLCKASIGQIFLNK